MRYTALFSALSGDAGTHASSVPPWLNALVGYIDYAWFFALLGWSLVLALWLWQTRRHAPINWRWLPWVAASGVLTAAITLVDLTTARLGSSSREAFAIGDHALALVSLLTASALAWEFSRGRRALVRLLCWLLVLAPLALFTWSIFHPAPGTRNMLIPRGAGLTLFSTLAAAPWVLTNRSPWAVCGLALAALAPCFGTVGPFAAGAFFMTERYGPLSLLSVASGTLQGAAAALCLIGLVRLEISRLTAPARRELWREARPFLFGAIATLALALLAAGWIGGRQRRSAEDAALDQVRLAVARLDARTFERLTGPSFRLDWTMHGALPVFPPTRFAHSDFLRRGGDAEARRALFPIAQAARTMTHLRFVTMRDGWLVGLAGFSSPWIGNLAHYFASHAVIPNFRPRRATQGAILLLRRPTAADTAHWQAKREVLEGPLYTPVFPQSVLFARAPIATPDGRMLGWLEFTYPGDAFLAETIQSRIAPFVGGTLGILLLGLFFAQKRAARERETALASAAVAAESARIKTDFMAKVSHELRTPLQSILGYGQLLESEISTPIGRTHLASQRQQSTLMLRLVNDLLDLNAIEAGAFRFALEPVSPADLVQQIVASLQPRAAGKNLVLHCAIASEVPAWIQADPERLRQIALNLIGNALKFTDRGRVDVALTVVQRDAKRCRLALVVRDTGPGIPPADQPKLFQPFSRLDLTAAKEGTGLGLALVAALCRTAGGAATVESDGATGSCFSVTLPFALSSPPEISPPRASTQLHGHRILIADDNPLVRELFTCYLTELGATCDRAVDGAQALAHALATPYDALVLDLAMPQLDGLEITRRLRARPSVAPRPRIVGVSAHAAASDRQRALAAGMDAFLTKPVELPALTAALSASAPEQPFPSFLQPALDQMFRADVESQVAMLQAALGQRDWSALRSRAHYLKNSAAVVRDDPLYEACTLLESAAEHTDSVAAHSAWQSCLCALARWRA